MTTAAFIDLCNHPWGEPLVVGFKVMVPSPVGGTNLIYEMTDSQRVVKLSDVRRKREKKHGIMQGQAWQIQLTNNDRQYTNTDFSDAVAQVVVEFAGAGEFQAVAQGRVYRAGKSTDGTITFEIHDTIIELLGFQLLRDIHYQSIGWLGDLQTYSKAPSSKGWDSTVDLVLNSPGEVEDETFYITFTSATAFDVTRDLGAEIQSGNIAADMDVSTSEDDQVITIPSSGWSTDAGAYSAGDTFIFFTARARTAEELSPVHMIIKLIEQAVTDIPIISTVPVVGSPFHDYDNWTTAAASTLGDEIGGFWSKGTPVSRMIQDALKIIHGAIYSVASGKLALWHLQPNTSARIALNGDPENGIVNVIKADSVQNLSDMVSAVTYEYLDLEGNDAAVTSRDDETVLTTEKIETVRIGWRVRGLSVESAANIHLNRQKAGRKEFAIKTTLAGILADVGAGLSITEPDLNLTVDASDVTDVSMTLLENTVIINAHVDPVATKNYAKVGVSKVGGSEVVW